MAIAITEQTAVFFHSLLLGAVLGWDVAFGAAGFLMESGEPVEYVLAWGGNEASLEGKLRAVSQHEGVICASRQREYSLVMGERQLTAGPSPSAAACR